MKLPAPIQAYFDADGRKDDKALIQSFAANAMVKDEGRTHVGPPAIGAWWRETKDRYQTVLEPLEIAAGGDGDLIEVRARVTGKFQGSPAMLSFRFRLDGDRISHLEIGA